MIKTKARTETLIYISGNNLITGEAATKAITFFCNCKT